MDKIWWKKQIVKIQYFFFDYILNLFHPARELHVYPYVYSKYILLLCADYTHTLFLHTPHSVYCFSDGGSNGSEYRREYVHCHIGNFPDCCESACLSEPVPVTDYKETQEGQTEKRERERKWERDGGWIEKEIEEKHALPFAFHLLSRSQCWLFGGSVQSDGWNFMPFKDTHSRTQMHTHSDTAAGPRVERAWVKLELCKRKVLACGVEG